MNKDFQRLDDNHATLRLIYLIWVKCNAENRTTLIETAKKHGVGLTSLYSSLRTLIELGLVEETTYKGSKLTTLTIDGLKIARIIYDLNGFFETRTSKTA